MRNKRCKTCKWVFISINPSEMNVCKHENRKQRFCTNEKSGYGNCGPQAKHWEAKDEI